MANEFSFLCLLTATRDPLGWRTRHRESDHTKLRNTQTEPKGKFYAYSINGVRTHSKQYHHKHIDYTLARNRSNESKYIKHLGTH
jgi:hypothetical protein